MPSNPKPCITSTSHCWATITKIAKLSLAVFTYQLKFQQDKMQEYFVTLRSLKIMQTALLWSYSVVFNDTTAEEH